jgi:hypothetical protein
VRRSAAVLAVAGLIGAGVATVAIVHAVGDRRSGGTDFSVAKAREFDEFPVYYAGDEVSGLPLTTVLRAPIPISEEGFGEEARGQVEITFIYGRCDIEPGQEGCGVPAAIAVLPACVLNLARSFPPPPYRTTIRGVPAAFFQNDTKLEVQTGISTVQIHGSNRRHVTTIAKALRGVNVPVQPGELLPPPAPGALDGTLRCARSS